MLVIPALGKLRQEDCQEFKASIGYVLNTGIARTIRARPCVNKTKKGVAQLYKIIISGSGRSEV